MPKKRALPSELLAWIEAQEPGSIMRRDTFQRIEDAAFDRLKGKGVPDDQARRRARSQAGSAYWRAATKQFYIATGQADPAARRKKPRKNPVLAVMGNPPRAGQIFSLDVHAITYTHKADGKDYRHEFGGDVHMRANPDGSITIYHPEKKVWRDFR